MLKDGKNEFTLAIGLPPKSRLYVARWAVDGEVTGTFTVGETITGGSSKKTAVIEALETDADDATVALIIHTDGGVSTGEAIEGGTSKATATMDGVPVACGHNGSTVDLTDYFAATVVFSAGSIGAATTAAPTIEESADGYTWSTVSSDRLNGTLANLSANSTLVIGVTDVTGLTKTYIRPVITITGSNPVLCSAYVMQGEPKSSPAGSAGTDILIG